MIVDKNNDFIKDVKLSAGRIAKRTGSGYDHRYYESFAIGRKTASTPTAVIEIERMVTKYYVKCGVEECEFQKFGLCTFITGRCMAEENKLNFPGMETREIIDMEKD